MVVVRVDGIAVPLCPAATVGAAVGIVTVPASIVTVPASVVAVPASIVAVPSVCVVAVPSVCVVAVVSVVVVVIASVPTIGIAVVVVTVVAIVTVAAVVVVIAVTVIVAPANVVATAAVVLARLVRAIVVILARVLPVGRLVARLVLRKEPVRAAQSFVRDPVAVVVDAVANLTRRPSGDTSAFCAIHGVLEGIARITFRRPLDLWEVFGCRLELPLATGHSCGHDEGGEDCQEPFHCHLASVRPWIRSVSPQ